MYMKHKSLKDSQDNKSQRKTSKEKSKMRKVFKIKRIMMRNY